jgi:lysophospholipase L1-like esterase
MQVKFATILLVAFVSGLVVGDWKPGIVGTLKARLGVQERMFDYEGPYYQSKLAFFRQTAGVADAVMLGDSLTEGIDWRELFPDVKILNRGISGDTSAGVLNRLDEVIGRHPKIVFLMIGVNDLRMGVPVPQVAANIRSIVQTLGRQRIRVALQKTLYVTSGYWPQINNKIDELNRSLSDLCTTSDVSCVDLNQALADGGALSPLFSHDGSHLNTAGYLAWKNEIMDLFPRRHGVSDWPQ